jgi:hypothetical protein
MRSLVTCLSMLALIACSTNSSNRAGPAALDPSVDFLLTAAANDFHAHAPPMPARFRNVRSGYVMTADGTRQYMLCGEFLPLQEGARPEWAFFATVKTSGYEQVLGGQTVGLCARTPVTWNQGDLSSSLQSRLDSLR